MDINSIRWFRNNVNYTENSTKVGRNGIPYEDMTKSGARYRFVDFMKAADGLRYYGTPGEYSAMFEPSKYISVSSSPSLGKVMYVNYPANPTLTERKVFPGSESNGGGESFAAPQHMIKLYFAGRTSLRLNTDVGSAGYKTWS
jgi:hypothetical protein|tara:strand:- start:222 stop:650 length:429 start_codon:yes stop_codon:yes gene_type:complete